LGDHDVGPPVVDGQLLGEAVAELDMVQAQEPRCLLGLGRHLGGHVHADDLTAGADEVGGHDRVEPATRPDLDHPVARVERPQREGVRHPGEGLHGAIR